MEKIRRIYLHVLISFRRPLASLERLDDTI
jgi:hypothetical protein